MTRSSSSQSMQPLQLASMLRHGTVSLTHWKLAPLMRSTSRWVVSGYPIRCGTTPYSGLAVGGTEAGAPGSTWAMLRDVGSSVESTMARATSTAFLLSIVSSIELVRGLTIGQRLCTTSTKVYSCVSRSFCRIGTAEPQFDGADCRMGPRQHPQLPI